MGGVSITTTGGTEIMIKEEAIGVFRASLRGDILEPRDAQYDDSRKIWNGMIDKRPALIVRCAGVSDVLQCVRFARSHQVPVAVRGGGHNVAGYAMCNGGMVIDLARMRSVQVDPVRRTARAEGGAIWADVDHETQAFGLATTGGTVSDTGIGGLTLGGGFGWLMGKHGLTCDNLLSLDMVTADGQFRTVRATEHPDLFWAVRGGGGNFGVVTAFEYQLHPVGPVVAGMLLYPVAQAKSILAHCCDFLRTAPEELGVVAGLLTSPEGAQLCGVVVCYNGPQAAGERVLQPLRAFGTPSLDILVHSLANSPEVKKPLLETSRGGYLAAVSVSAYSLVALTRRLGPMMRRGGAVVSLTYMASERAIPGYGGGMSSAKAALESDTRTLAFEAGRAWRIRVNTISAGPFASRAASAIGIIDRMVAYCAANSPLPEALQAMDVGHAAAFLCSPLAAGITGTTLYVDKGYHSMGMAVDTAVQSPESRVPPSQSPIPNP